MPKLKNKLQQLDQVDAKSISNEVTLTSLDALLGEDNSNPYKTSSLDEYESFINELNSTDLHRHAEKVGLVPSVERRVLKDRLVREFKRFVASRSSSLNNLSNLSSSNVNSTDCLSKEAQKVLREGA
jgi:hypothetical protein